MAAALTKKKASTKRATKATPAVFVNNSIASATTATIVGKTTTTIKKTTNFKPKLLSKLGTS